MTRIILDVDTGIDDAMAILYALGHPEITLEAVTCTFGNIDVDSATRNTLQVLEAAGRGDIPVATGARRALTRPYEKRGSRIHGANGIGDVVMPDPQARALDTWGPDLIIDMVRAAPDELILVPVGPMTNVAHALMKAPDIAEKLKGIVLMGGTIWHPGVPGIPSPVADANFFNDPEAARIVFQSGARVTMIGMDVTMKTRLTAAMMADIAKRGGVAAGHVMQAARFYLAAYQAQYPGIDWCALHDPLAVAVAHDPSLVTCEAMQVDVECAGTLTRGQVIPDRRKTGKTVPNALVALEVDSARFEEAFTETLVSV
ncbi:nucleoside hydrolase [Pseudooceanicola algae]|uniref:Pyrimidine-specific ribonucleoside hydrolase RihA n=1 Tax=Pseudooceanicola algae TaxID=1537215 RepID=A0A418SFW6_9RHOB|nr:nucleoside hydrolase [Pseudooceanicola algae]QPM91532.1 Pyrimidine-specific ribonucleoside hydrolase RihA [Pseudooceanicola algae]